MKARYILIAFVLLFCGCGGVRESREKKEKRIQPNKEAVGFELTEIGLLGGHDVHIVLVEGKKYIVVESHRGIAICPHESGKSE